MKYLTPFTARLNTVIFKSFCIAFIFASTCGCGRIRVSDVYGLYECSRSFGNIEQIEIKEGGVYHQTGFTNRDSVNKNAPFFQSTGGSWKITGNSITFKNWYSLSGVLNGRVETWPPKKADIMSGSYFRHAENGAIELVIFEDDGYIFKKLLK